MQKSRNPRAIRSAGKMIWTGILLCFGIASAQGQPSRDATDVTLDKLNGASDGQIFFHQTTGQIQSFYFKFSGNVYAVVRAPRELRPTWEQAKERCQKLADRLGPGPGTWDLAPIMKTAEKWATKWHQDWDKQTFKDFGKAIIGINNDFLGEIYGHMWVANPTDVKPGECAYLSSLANNFYTQACDKPLYRYICQFS